MMAQAGRYFWWRGLGWLTALVVLGAVAMETYGRFRASQLLQSLAHVEFAQVGTVLDDIGYYRRWTRARVDRATRAVSNEPQHVLRLRLALLRLRAEGDVVDSLCDQMLEAEPGVFAVLRDELAQHGAALIDRLWRELERETGPPPRRLRAACALASYTTPDDPRWPAVLDFVVKQMIDTMAVDPGSHIAWRAALQPQASGCCLLGKVSPAIPSAPRRSEPLPVVCWHTTPTTVPSCWWS
jgi:hypothetical protein